MSKRKYIVKDIPELEKIGIDFIQKISSIVEKDDFGKVFLSFINDYEKHIRSEGLKLWTALVDKIKIYNYEKSYVDFFTPLFNSESNKLFWVYKYYSLEYKKKASAKSKQLVIQSFINNKFLIGTQSSLDVVNKILYMKVFGDEMYNGESNLSKSDMSFITIIAFLENVVESLGIEKITINKLIKFLEQDKELIKLNIKIPRRRGKFYTDFKSRNFQGWRGISNNIQNYPPLAGSFGYCQVALYDYLKLESTFCLEYDLTKPHPLFMFGDIQEKPEVKNIMQLKIKQSRRKKGHSSK